MQHVRLRYFVVMKLSEDGALVLKHVGVGIKYEVWFVFLLYSTWYIFWLICLACLSLGSCMIKYFITFLIAHIHSV